MKKNNDLRPTSERLKIILHLIFLVSFCVAFGPILNAQLEISGPSLLCTSGQYYLNCECSITWSCTSNLTMTSQQGSNPCTFSANGNGLAIITATIYCGGTQHAYDTVWVGTPIIEDVVDEGKYPSQHLYDCSFWPAYYDISEPEYSLDVDYPGEVWYCDQSWAQVYLPGDPSEYSFLLISTNTCGYDWTVFYWDDIWGDN
ncbi:MAG TPA: hypothetical protein PK719_05075 [Bacteroidales bacterium]|nr:MAG: hypothetical protein BWX96_02661 [Bacteroidetes bacterium ADurb.Bin145]HOU03287.1 hypothetical protein [Bacteroidales bacterium]HQG63006.1 hypothetical protein [Bacteroidales bacterium]HQK69187.1 hypothetical protein [Bacteroidales bacterium]